MQADSMIPPPEQAEILCLWHKHYSQPEGILGNFLSKFRVPAASLQHSEKKMDFGRSNKAPQRACKQHAVFLAKVMWQCQHLCRREAAAPYENPIGVRELPSRELQRR